MDGLDLFSLEGRKMKDDCIKLGRGMARIDSQRIIYSVGMSFLNS